MIPLCHKKLKNSVIERNKEKWKLRHLVCTRAACMFSQKNNRITTVCHIEKDVMSKRILLNLAQRVSKWIVNEVADGDPYVCNFVIITKMCSQIRHAAHGSIVFMFSFSEFKLLYTKSYPEISTKNVSHRKSFNIKTSRKIFWDAIFGKINSFGVTSMQRTFSFGFPWKAENARKRQQTSSDIYYSMRIVTEWTSRGIKQMKCDCSLEINFILCFFSSHPREIIL